MQNISYQDLKDLMSGDKGSDDPRLAGALGVWKSDMGSGSNNPLHVEAIVQQALSIKVFLPEVIRNDTISDLRKMKEFIDNEQYVLVRQPIPFPNLPTENDLYDIVINKIFEPIFTNQNITNRGQLHEFWMNRSRNLLINSYKDIFGQFEALAISIQQQMITSTQNQFETIREDTNYVVSTIESSVERARLTYDAVVARDNRKTTVNIYKLSSTRLPLGLQKNYFMLPPDTVAYRYFDRENDHQSLKGVRPANSKFRDTFERIEAVKPSSYQGIMAKALARHLARFGNEQASKFSREDRRLGEKARENALAVLDIALGIIPVTGLPRDLYEAYTGEDIMTGRVLSDTERALKAAIIGSVGFAKFTPKQAISWVFESITIFGKRALGLAEPEGLALANTLGKFNGSWTWPEVVAKLREASEGVLKYNPKKGRPYDFPLGSITRAEADMLGRAWVGEDIVPVIGRDGKKFFISKDGLTQYRPPDFKPDLNKFQANFQKRLEPEGTWLSNGHFDITD
jgi:hypothetical protein